MIISEQVFQQFSQEEREQYLDAERRLKALDIPLTIDALMAWMDGVAFGLNKAMDANVGKSQ